MISITEQIFTRPEGYGIPATNCQRAWCRILDGVPLGNLWKDPAVRLMCGSQLPNVKPQQFVGTKSPRCGGSLILAAWEINRALFADVSKIGPKENPPILPNVSIRKLNARAIVGHVRRLMEQPHWRSYVDGTTTADQVVIKHLATDMPIAIKVIAGSRAASNLESYWHASVAFDEVFKLLGEEDAVVNLDDARTAVLGRLIPGAQVAYVGSPWVAMGPAYDLLEEHFGAPNKRCIAVRATGPMMFPHYWTEAKIEELANSKDQQDRDMALLAMGEFISRSSGLLSEHEISACSNRTEADYPRRPGVAYMACMDPATRRNAWTLVVTHREGVRLVVDMIRQWTPRAGERLSARQVLGQVAWEIGKYGLREVFSDQWSSDTLAELAELSSLKLTEKQLRGPLAQQALKMVVDGVAAGNFDLPNDVSLRKDLLNLKRKVTQAGPHLFLGATPDGRHADYVPPLALAATLTPTGAVLDFAEAFPSGFMGKLGRTRNPEDDYPAERLGVLKAKQLPFKLF